MTNNTEHEVLMHERNEALARAEHAEDCQGPSKEGVTTKARELTEAERLLVRIRSARESFSVDPGGPETPVAGMIVIEEWIRHYFDKYPLYRLYVASHA